MMENEEPRLSSEMEKVSEEQVEVQNGAVESLNSIDIKMLKRIKLKSDFILLPVLTFAYLVNSLDRSNMSNAYTAGLATDLHLKGNQFNQLLTYYQIPFIVLGPLTTMLTKVVGARLGMSVMLLIFGASSLASGFATTFTHLVICRVFVGAFESGFLAAVIYYLSTWYTRKELAGRIGIFYAALVSSSAFGGLLAYGIFRIKSGSLFNWSYLFILEGSLTMIAAITIFFILPVSPKSAWFLNEAEKEAAVLRIEQDSASDILTDFSFKEAFAEFLTPHAYIRLVLSFVAVTMLTSNSNFLAIVVKRLGYGVVKTNLYTVAPSLVGAVFLVGWCKSSDFFLERPFHIAASAVVSLVGYIILATIDTNNTSALYFAIFLCTIGAYPSTPIGATWTISNVPNLNARAMMSGFYISAGNCAGLLSSNIYLQKEAPRYITSIRVNIAMSVLLAVLSIAYSFWMKFENRRRDEKYGKVDSHQAIVGIFNTNDKRFRFQT